MLPLLSFLHICNKQFQFINCGRLLPGVWDGAETSGISCLHYWACGIIRRLSDKKSLKTKPKKSRPTTCKRNLSGICKLSSPSAAKPPSFPCSRAIPLAGWRDHRSVAGVGQVLLITKELLFGEAQLSKQLRPQCTQLCRKISLALLTQLFQSSRPPEFPGGWCMLLSTDRGWGGGGWAFPRKQC